ncbi:LPD38 domain-containing protein [Fictibacillus gelatini]|uniref:LPD38 domain-containing protein n=1 Tax=Fictibacillus gelatini TaxID=225985 RepID=UPI00041CFA2D|nr:LPD38 domain-containing protein [Fictibacillus gelatini]
MPYKFDDKKYKKIFEQMYGKGSYDSGISRAGEVGRLQAKAALAKENYIQRMKEAEAEAKYQQHLAEIEKYGMSKKKYDENQAKWKYMQNQVKGFVDFGKNIGKIGEKVFGHPIKEAKKTGEKILDIINPFDSSSKKNDKINMSKQDLMREEMNYKRLQANGLADPPKKSKPKKKKKEGFWEGLGHDLAKTSKNAYHALNPFDDVSFKEAITGEVKRKRSNASKEINRSAARTLNSATLGALEYIDKKQGGKQAERFATRKFGEGGAIDLMSDLAGFLVPGTGSIKAAKSVGLGAKGLKEASTAKKALQIAKQGAAAGAIYEGARGGVKAALDHESYSGKDHLKNIALGTVLGAVADPLIEIGGSKLLKGLSKLKSSDKGVKTHPIAELKNAIETTGATKEQPVNVLSNKGLTKLADNLPKSKSTTEKFEAISAEPQPKLVKVKEMPDFFRNNDGVIPDTRGHIVSKTVVSKIPLSELKNKAYIKGVDNLHRLKQFDEAVEKITGNKLKASESTHILGLNSRGSDMISKQILTQNVVDSKGNVIGQSLKDIAKKIPKGKEVDFEDYLINKHAITRMGRGEKVFPDEMKMSPEKSAAIVKAYEQKHPEFKQLAKEYYDYNKQLGKAWLVDTGILTPEQWEGYLKANPHYVPNNRAFKDIERSLFTGRAKKGFANQTNPVKKATGSQRQIISPLESTIEHTANYIKTAKRNEVMQTLIRNISKNPEAFKGWAEIVPTKDSKDVLETLNKEGIEGLLENFNKGFDQKPDLNKGNVVSGIVNGQKVHVRVHDPALLDALTNLDPKAQNIIIHSLGQVTRVMKNLTTGINPIFSLTRNIFRDIPTAYVNSKSTSNPFTFGKDLLGAVVSVIKNDELYRSFKAVGGGHSSPIASDVNLLAQSKRSILPQKGIKPLLGKGLAALENLNNAVETAPRLAEYKRFAKNGDYDSKVRGLYEANDVTVNFNKYGNVTKDADAIIPYLNAAIQGLDKTYRAFKDNPVKAGVKAFTAITVPSIVLYAINHKDPNYQKLSNFIKDTNFLIPKGDGTFYKIPKPRELGVLFGSDVERVLRKWQDDDPEAFEKFSNTILDAFKPPARSVLAPFTDLRANKDFAGRPIVPGDLQRLSPKYQYDSRTSEVSKWLGDKLNLSPKQLDYLANSYGGVIADLGIPATASDNGGNPLDRISETLKRQVTADPVYSNDILDKFYSTKEKLDRANADYKATGERSNDLNERLRKIFGRQSRQISDVRKSMKQIQNNKSLPFKERQDKLRELQKKLNSIADKTNKLVR